jgi:folate-dependent phosphoribosylglycinamide formyltransferase PurN
VDTPAWKQDLADALLGHGIELGVIYSRSRLTAQAAAGLQEFGFGLVSRYLERRASSEDGGAARASTLGSWALLHGVAQHNGSSLRDPATVEWVRSFAPDLLVLVGADLVPASILALPRLGTINPHYGLLPRYRGMNVTEWSIYHDDPVGVTVHMVDSHIDAGDILVRESVSVPIGATLDSIRAQQQKTSARLLEACALAIAGGASRRIAQRPEDGRQFYRMHPLLRDRVERRLASGSYQWLGVPEPPVDETLAGLKAP